MLFLYWLDLSLSLIKNKILNFNVLDNLMLNQLTLVFVIEIVSFLSFIICNLFYLFIYFLEIGSMNLYSSIQL